MTYARAHMGVGHHGWIWWRWLRARSSRRARCRLIRGPCDAQHRCPKTSAALWRCHRGRREAMRAWIQGNPSGDPQPRRLAQLLEFIDSCEAAHILSHQRNVGNLLLASRRSETHSILRKSQMSPFFREGFRSRLKSGQDLKSSLGSHGIPVTGISGDQE